eukprot:TRINITY_DN1899_c0_g1_i12.p1 TRINITY_DN1899_c0_g1~~TRINITY_DN1899_c0_g1_i12.p1  ORF type:complete len:307 (+),score=95.27 TRINITY_DN1899_c0_g1_i12:101-1021(+)
MSSNRGSSSSTPSAHYRDTQIWTLLKGQKENELRGIFEMIDVGNKGFINIEDLSYILSVVGVNHSNEEESDEIEDSPSEEDLEVIMESLNLRNDGMITFTDFVNAMVEIDYTSLDEILPPTSPHNTTPHINTNSTESLPIDLSTLSIAENTSVVESPSSPPTALLSPRYSDNSINSNSNNNSNNNSTVAITSIPTHTSSGSQINFNTNTMNTSPTLSTNVNSNINNPSTNTNTNSNATNTPPTPTNSFTPNAAPTPFVLSSPSSVRSGGRGFIGGARARSIENNNNSSSNLNNSNNTNTNTSSTPS